ncbi:nitronate monooxygenase [Saccharothrix ecbatanensis]|uniref:Propionate 3-nitronate monooxygenase n=1 Tax=Saccharothrix ecbatanensis TaxID=1105145 RepID=A0A7W9M5U1_9PSEU|nr:nitronate monooxygenase [Saccharothrix ecbatanensis]MBB5808289.1 nitronate monooxygenase [Saccharothrix ecbatanensis]
MLDRLEVPVIAAPMAGGASTPELVAAVGGAGGLGFLAAGYLSVEAVAEQITATTALTDRPFGVNLFVPGPRSTADISGYRERVRALSPTEPGEPTWDDDAYAAKLELVMALRVPIVSFTFGLPNTEDVHRLHAAGATVVVTVTTPQEAAQAAQIGADALCVQGSDAGGHRGTFADDGISPGGGELFGVLAALRLVRARVDLPLIATGGLVHGADVAAVVTAGAIAAQLGTAFLAAPEAGTSAAHRQALAEGTRRTALTRAFSGRPARGLVNRFLVENQGKAPAAYPEVHHLTKPVRATGDPELMSMWAGQTYPLVRPAPAAEIVARLVTEAREAFSVASTRIQPG